MSDVEQHVYDDPTKYFQGVHVPSGETYAQFWAWWKAECARRDAVPKQIIRSDPNRWSATNGKRK